MGRRKGQLTAREGATEDTKVKPSYSAPSFVVYHFVKLQYDAHKHSCSLLAVVDPSGGEQIAASALQETSNRLLGAKVRKQITGRNESRLNQASIDPADKRIRFLSFSKETQTTTKGNGSFPKANREHLMNTEGPTYEKGLFL